MQHNNLFNRLRELIYDILRAEDMELVDFQYKKEGSARILSIKADKNSGINIDECSRINRVIGEALDKENIMEENYLLEVSSPGLDRPLKSKRDFERAGSKKICVYTYAPVEEKKEFTGTLRAVDEAGIEIESDNAKMTKIPFDKISKATLDYRNLI